MMTVAAAGAAFYWITKIQGQMMGGTEQYEEKSFERLASTVVIISNAYDAGTETLSVYFQNLGTTTIPMSNDTTDPTTIMKMANSDSNIVCAEKIATFCTGCGGNLGPQGTQKISLALSGTNCDLSSQINGTSIYLDFFLSGKATASTSFTLD